jgi:hypothetical protein
MMTTLAMYTVSAALYAASPSDQGNPQAGGSASDPAAPSGAQVEEQGLGAGEPSDPGQAMSQGRRPPTRGDSTSKQGMSSTSGGEVVPTNPAETGPTSESLRQQESWTAP